MQLLIDTQILSHYFGSYSVSCLVTFDAVKYYYGIMYLHAQEFISTLFRVS